MSRLTQVTSILSLAKLGLALLPIPNIIPLALDGALDNCAVDNTTQYNSGGSLTVNGINVKVPTNLIAQFPVAWVPWRDVCAGGVGGYEVSVFGNYVNGQAIAAQVIVGSPFLVEGSQGYIESIDLTQGTLKIRGGPVVRINDPNGVFGRAYDPKDLFMADDENPSITAFSGYPMCIPRSASGDSLCPSSNRPAGTSNFQAPDPLVMAPLLAGDFIEYSGIVRGNEVMAWAITALNVQITTSASDTVPNYIRMEDALIGVFDTAANVEIADIRFIGYLSSCTGASVSVNAIDVDPCTGEETIRQVGVAVPKAGDVRCKWEFRADTTTQNTYTREYLIKANNPVLKTKNGILGGQYVQPVTEWIQPEVDIPGTEPVPYVFRNIRGLVEGDFLDDQQFGPLSPFPGPAPPAPSKTCSPGDIPNPTNPVTVNPVASVAPISAVQRVGAQIFLVASQTAQGIPSDQLVYNWTQTSPASPTVSIQNAASPSATIVAPSVTAETNFTFQVKISLKSNSTSFSTANVTIKVNSGQNGVVDVVTLDTYTWVSSQSGTISVTCYSNVVNGDNKKMSLLLNNGATTLTMTAGSGPGKWLYSSRSVKKPTNVQCVSDLKGKSAVVTATTNRKRGLLGMGTMSRAG